MRVHLIHGIHTSGPSPIQGLIPFLTDFDTVYPDYGYILGVETRIVNPIVVGTLKAYVDHGDILIGHSNGCAIAYDLMNLGIQLAGAIFINAALKQNIQRPAMVPWIDVYFNAGDTITEAAKIGAELGIDDPVWGEMGHAGYAPLRGGVPDAMIINWDCENTAGMPKVDGHSAFLLSGNLAAWGLFLVKRLKKLLAIEDIGNKPISDIAHGAANPGIPPSS